MKPIESNTPLLGFAAYSGTGKTTLLSAVIPLLKQQGIRVGIIKHAHHKFDIDHPGKDSYQLRKAGAGQMLIASKKRWALMVETEHEENDPSLQALIDHLDPNSLDIILVEGFKHESFAKIELHRDELDKELMYLSDGQIIAIASNVKLDTGNQLPVLDINNPEQVADFIVSYIKNHNN